MIYIADKNLIRNGLEASCRLLEENRDRLNRMNYFPVADKDTGTNMAMSTRKALDYLESFGEDQTPAELLQHYYDGLLEYSRGNSGTILAMFAEGFANVMPRDGNLSGRILAEAFDSAAKNACFAVAKVKEGTILTVSLDAARAGLSACEMTDDPIYIWRRICEEAHAALAMTAFRNPVLRTNGVADAGAFGMCLILDGLLSVLCPEEELPPYNICEDPLDIPDADIIEGFPVLAFPYCTELVIQKAADTESGADAKIRSVPELRAALEDLGDCLHCIENAEKIKLHIHTADPLEVVRIASAYGSIVSEKIENMINPDQTLQC